MLQTFQGSGDYSHLPSASSACSGALRNIRTTMRLAEGGVVLGLLLAALLLRARPAALALAALSFGVARLCAVLDARMRVGRYPPPRNVS